MKKILALILTLVMTASIFASCNEKVPNEDFVKKDKNFRTHNHIACADPSCCRDRYYGQFVLYVSGD